MRVFYVFGGSGANGGPVCPLGSTLGTILVAFALLFAPFGAPWAPKAVQKSKKIEKMKSCIALGAPRGQKDAKGAPGPPKWTPKARQRYKQN